MRDIQIHAGIHKTGSTAIQHSLARLAPDLAEHGVVLPHFGTRGQLHHGLAAFATEPETCARAWTRLARRVRRSGAGRVVLSSEHFVGADPEALRAALARFGGHRLRIHFYVRPHVALFTSLYLQRVKAGAAVTAPSGVAERYTSGPEFDYIPAIERYITVFGADAVRVREFDPDRFEGGSLIADAWHFLDLPDALRARAAQACDATVNPTPTAEQAVLLIALARRLRAVRPRGGDVRPVRAALRTLLDELRLRMPGPGSRYRLPPALQRRIAARTDAARGAFAHRLDRPASAAFLHEATVAPDPLGPIPFDAARAGLAAAAAMLHERGWPHHAAATGRLAGALASEPGPDGTPCLRLPEPAPELSEAPA
jgi:hypothetical protein